MLKVGEATLGRLQKKEAPLGCGAIRKVILNRCGLL